MVFLLGIRKPQKLIRCMYYLCIRILLKDPNLFFSFGLYDVDD